MQQLRSSASNRPTSADSLPVAPTLDSLASSIVDKELNRLRVQRMELEKKVARAAMAEENPLNFDSCPSLFSSLPHLMPDSRVSSPSPPSMRATGAYPGDVSPRMGATRARYRSPPPTSPASATSRASPSSLRTR